jgi:uncharacterized DUF497 family protein
MDISKKLIKCIGFTWDKANSEKNWLKHSVTPSECEQIFFNTPLIDRYYALGKTEKNRWLFIVFTVRKNHVRVISARNMNKKERQVYNNHEKNS